MENSLEICRYLSEERIIDLKATTKTDALNELIDLIIQDDLITEPELFRNEIFKREKSMSTGIGHEIAIPHFRHHSINDFVIALGRSRCGIEFEAIDEKPVKLIFMIGATDTHDKDYIKLLSKLVHRMNNDDFKEALLSAESISEIMRIVKEMK